MISKELLEIVLDYKNIISINIVGNNICTIRKNDNCILSETHNNISIYEFAHKCKVWSRDKDIFLRSFYDYEGAFCYISAPALVDKIEIPKSGFWSETEVEAIFKASEWILNNIGREDMNGN